jgi:O-acetyl-ADP-ribose deacetylase
LFSFEKCIIIFEKWIDGGPMGTEITTVAEFKTGKCVLRLVKGDITERKVDAIVNAANSYLQHGGGVAAAIAKKGGPVIQEESDMIGFTPVGASVITGAGNLPARFVIHTVGPRMGEGDEDNKLKKALAGALSLASEKNLKSISLPAISSGTYGFPKERCAKILISGALDFLKTRLESTLELIEFCIYDNLTLGYFKKEFDHLK